MPARARGGFARRGATTGHNERRKTKAHFGLYPPDFSGAGKDHAGPTAHEPARSKRCLGHSPRARPAQAKTSLDLCQPDFSRCGRGRPRLAVRESVSPGRRLRPSRDTGGATAAEPPQRSKTDFCHGPQKSGGRGSNPRFRRTRRTFLDAPQVRPRQRDYLAAANRPVLRHRDRGSGASRPSSLPPVRPSRSRHSPLVLGLWPLALGLGPWAFGLWPWALGLWPLALGLGPLALGLGPWALGLGPLASALSPSQRSKILKKCDIIHMVLGCLAARRRWRPCE